MFMLHIGCHLSVAQLFTDKLAPLAERISMLMEAKYEEGVRSVVTDVEQAPPHEDEKSKSLRKPTRALAEEAPGEAQTETTSDAEVTAEAAVALINPFASNKIAKDGLAAAKAVAPDTAKADKRKMPVVPPSAVKKAK